MPTYADIVAAHDRILPHIHLTPLMRSTRIDERAGAHLFFKCENFQKVGAFKARGACNAVYSLHEATAKRGVVTHSSGNHGAALAWAARKRGIPCVVVVPENAPAIKKAAIAGYGATIVPCAPNVHAREAACREQMEKHGMELVHPFDDERVIAGQGTCVKEMLEEIPDLDIVIAPTGGGGLLSGTAIAAKAIQPGITVIGAEPLGASDATQGFRSGTRVAEFTPATVCDGLRTPLAERTFAIIRQNVDSMATATEANIIAAMRLMWESLKIIVESSCSPPLAAILEGTADVKGKRVGIILTGGNVDLDKLPWQA